jgi:hypothetical protein
MVNGIIEVSYSDGSFIRGEAYNSVLNGFVVEFDSNGRQKFVGKYQSGRLNFVFIVSSYS